MSAPNVQSAPRPVQSDQPVVSIVIPCRNERIFIESCLDSIINNGYPLACLDVVVVDGMSDDGTREILNRYAARYDCIRMVDNVRQTTPYAFNVGIKEAKGELVMIMSAHAAYDPGAVSQSVARSREFGADNVGGMWKIEARSQGAIAEAIVAASSHRFGVGSTTYRTGTKKPVWVDTAAYGCYRREVFTRIGLFNERLTRGQDMEFNRRLLAAGGRTLLAPEIVIRYFARTELQVFLKHSFNNGVWAIVPFAFSDVIPVSPRHLAPLAFAFSLTVATIAAAVRPDLAWILVAISAVYGIAAITAAVDCAMRGLRPTAALVLPGVFAGLHLCYGFGSIWGALKTMWLMRDAAAKRLLDLAGSTVGLLALSPVLLALSAWIKLNSPGPLFYRGERTARGGNRFRIFKFRTMVVDAERIGGPSTADGDPRVTRAGRFLRKYKLDELPQLLNVLLGDMSLVGPRPEVPVYTNLYTEKEREILTVRPGITDLATLWNPDEGSLLAGEADPEKAYLEKIRPTKIKLQLEYVRNRSFLLDIKIIISTAAIVLRKGLLGAP